MDPVAVIRSKRYIGALVLAAIVGIPVSVVAYGFLASGRCDPAISVHRAAESDAREPRTRVVAAALVGAVRAVSRVDHPIPAGQRRTFARIGLSNRRRTGHRTRAARHHPRCLGHTRPRRRARARSTPDRDRRRAWCAGRPPGKEGRATDGLDDHGVGRQLCGNQHTVRLPRARCVPDHGDRGDQRDDAEPGGAARSAGLRHWCTGLRRSGQLDRPRHLLPRADVRAACGPSDFGQLWLGR